MKTIYLGHTGYQSSQLGFGTMPAGGDADEETLTALCHRCRKAEINFSDCADVYQDRRSEEILGRLIWGERKGE